MAEYLQVTWDGNTVQLPTKSNLDRYIYNCDTASGQDNYAIKDIIDEFISSTDINSLNLMIVGKISLLNPNSQLTEYISINFADSTNKMLTLDFTNAEFSENRHGVPYIAVVMRNTMTDGSNNVLNIIGLSNHDDVLIDNNTIVHGDISNGSSLNLINCNITKADIVVGQGINSVVRILNSTLNGVVQVGEQNADYFTVITGCKIYGKVVLSGTETEHDVSPFTYMPEYSNYFAPSPGVG